MPGGLLSLYVISWKKKTKPFLFAEYYLSLRTELEDGTVDRERIHGST